MKKLIITIASFALLASHAHADTYPLTTVVTDVDHDADIVEVLDFNGNQWLFEGAEDWFVGDICSMIMDDNDTDEVFDDEIVCARCDGWLETWAERFSD